MASWNENEAQASAVDITEPAVVGLDPPRTHEGRGAKRRERV